MLPSAELRTLIDAAAALVGLPTWEWAGESYAAGEWLEALIYVESGGNPRAVRYEPSHDVVVDGDTPGRDDGMLEDDKSYGAMQVLGSNIRRLCGVPPGTPMEFGFALLPLTNLALGLRILTGELATVNGDVAKALARYNGGRRGSEIGPDGRMRRQQYVERVAAASERVRRDRERSET